MPRVRLPHSIKNLYLDNGWRVEFSSNLIEQNVWQVVWYACTSRYMPPINIATIQKDFVETLLNHLKQYAEPHDTLGWICKTYIARACQLCGGNDEVEKDILGRRICLRCVNRNSEKEDREVDEDEY